MTDPIPATEATDPRYEIREPESYYAVGLTGGTTSLFASDVKDPVSESMRTGFFGRKFVGIEARRSWPMLFDGFRVEPWLSWNYFRENSGRTAVSVRNGSAEANLGSDGQTINLGLRGTKTLWGEFGLTAGPFVYMEWGGYDSDAKSGGDPTGFWNSVVHYGGYSGKGVGFQVGPAWRGQNFDVDLVFEWAHGGRNISYQVPGNPSSGSDPSFSAGTDRYGARLSVLFHGDAAKVVIPSVGVGEEPPPPEPEPEPKPEMAPEPPVPAGPADVVLSPPRPFDPPPPSPAAPVTSDVPVPAPGAAGVSDSAREPVVADETTASTAERDAAATAARTTAPVCGDRKVDSGEECDDGNRNNDDECDNACKKKAAPPEPICGDGKKEGTEQCDDGNTNPGDGCDAACQTETTAEPVGYTPPRPAKPTVRTESVEDLHREISRRFYWQVIHAMHYGFQNMEAGIRDKIIAAYTPVGGTFDEEKFLRAFAGVVVGKVKGLQWKQEKGRIYDDDGIFNPHDNSDAEAATFDLGYLGKKELKGLGKSVVGAVFIEADEAKMIDTLHNTALFTRYGTTAKIGIVRAGTCGSGNVYIQFGLVKSVKGVGQDQVIVVNDNRDELSTRGIQSWRLVTPPVPAGCPVIHDIGTNIGLQAIFPYKHRYGGKEKDGYVLIYFLLATPSSNPAPGTAMENTLEGVEQIADGSPVPTL